MSWPSTPALVWTIAVWFLLVASCTALPRRKLSSFIKHYEPLDYDLKASHEVHTRFTKEWQIGNTLPYDFVMNIWAHGRHFRLELSPDDEVFAKGAQLLAANGEPVEFNRAELLVGRVHGDNHSHVHGYIINGRFRGVIRAFGEKFAVEPTLVHFEEEQDFHSVMYKESDVDYDQIKMPHACGGVNHSNSVWMEEQEMLGNIKDHLEEKVKSRQRRAVDLTKVECPLNIAGDFTFARQVAKLEALPATDKNRIRSAVFQNLALFVREANKIITATTFFTTSTRPEGIRMAIQTARAYLDEAEMEAARKGTKLTDSLIGGDAVLNEWRKFNWGDYCLSYIFTHRDYADNVLGLAFVGGICDSGRVASQNCGLVTTLNSGQTVSSLVSYLVFTHEVGHNFGAQHDDPKNAQCSPSDSAGGRFVMFSIVSKGTLPNNFKFSPCSVGYIGKKFMERVYASNVNCFTAKSDGQICGNGVKEGTEECDCGASDQCASLNKCCAVKASGARSTDTDCMLKPASNCSIQDGPCCSEVNCMPVNGSVCSEAHECRVGLPVCNGKSASCPRAPPVVNGNICNRNRSTCDRGDCDGSLCVLVNLKECSCPAPNECSVCCNTTKGVCTTLDKIPNVPNLAYLNLIKVPGSTCGNFTGHCNFLSFCRRNSDTSLIFQITNALFSFSTFDTAWAWAKTNWYYVILGVAGVVAGFALVIHFCAKKTPRTVEVHRARNPRSRNVADMELVPGH